MGRRLLDAGVPGVAFQIVSTSSRRENQRLDPVISINGNHDPVSLNGENRHRLFANPNDIARLENQLGIHAESASGTNGFDLVSGPRQDDASGDYTRLFNTNSIRFERKRESERTPS